MSFNPCIASEFNSAWLINKRTYVSQAAYSAIFEMENNTREVSNVAVQILGPRHVIVLL